MKTWVALLSILSVMAFAALRAEENCNCCGPAKTYITQEQLDILDNQIFVKIGETILKISALFADEGGLYFNMEKGPRTCHFWEIECPVCTRCKPAWKSVCPYCNNEPW